MTAVDKETWKKAQEAERRFHKKPKEVALAEYSDAYSQYFKWLGMDQDLKGKSIIEIGCADIPALYFCENINQQSTIVEPMPSSILDELSQEIGVNLIKDCAENLDLEFEYSEVWLFNVLQHVLDPDKLVENCKKWAKVVRFFEPVDQEISDCHPHAPTQEDFKRWFGDCVKYYPQNPNAKNFHTEHCSYGTWIKL